MATQVEILTRIAQAMADDVEVVEWANKKIQQINKSNEHKRAKSAEKNAEIKQAVYTYMATQDTQIENATFCASEIAGLHKEVMNFPEMSTSKASAVLRALVKDGRVVKASPDGASPIKYALAK